MREVIEGVVSCGFVIAVVLFASGLVFHSPPEARPATARRTSPSGVLIWIVVLAAVGTVVVFASHGAMPL